MAATDFCLVIDAVKGETADAKWKEAGGIDIESFSWGVSNAGSMSAIGGGGAGKASFQDIHFVKNVDKSSPALAQCCSTGKHISKAVLHVRKAGDGQKEYYTVTLEDILISSFQASAANGNPIVMDSFSINYAKIKWEYKTQDSKGAMVAGGDFKYDLKMNKA